MSIFRLWIHALAGAGAAVGCLGSMQRHSYGGHYGQYAACHLAAAVSNFAYVEWDEANTPGLITAGYAIEGPRGRTAGGGLWPGPRRRDIWCCGRRRRLCGQALR